MQNRHIGWVKASMLDDEFIAVCKCGWHGERQKTEKKAEVELRDHMEDVREHADA